MLVPAPARETAKPAVRAKLRPLVMGRTTGTLVTRLKASGETIRTRRRWSSADCGHMSCARPQPAATLDEMKYLRFVLLNVVSLDNSPAAVQSYEDHLVELHGLNAQESAVIHAAGQSLKPLLAQLRESARANSAANRPLSPGFHRPATVSCGC